MAKRRMRFVTWAKKDINDKTPISYIFTDSEGKTTHFTSENIVSFSFMARLREAWIEKIELVDDKLGKHWIAVLYED